MWPHSQKCYASKTTAADLNETEKDLVNVVMLFYVFSNVQTVKRARDCTDSTALVCKDLMRRLWLKKKKMSKSLLFHTLSYKLKTGFLHL